jgi:AcrR family transcriptional regulator
MDDCAENKTISYAPQPSARRPSGRPRRLTLDQVIDAARAVGLENLTLSAVARRLGVSMTVLYGYIANREELVRLAAAQVNRETAAVRDEGQHWSTFIAQVASALYAFLTGPGHLAHFLAGGLGPEVELDRAEAWLEKMTRSGFDAKAALIIHRQVGEIVVGGAVTALHARAMERAGRPYRQAALNAINTRPETTPLLAAEQQLFATREPVWQRTLMVFIAELAARRGEELAREQILGALDAGVSEGEAFTPPSDSAALGPG